MRVPRLSGDRRRSDAGKELSTLRLSVPMTETSNDIYEELSVTGDTVTGSPSEPLPAV